jgi:hypothetical protein
MYLSAEIKDQLPVVFNILTNLPDDCHVSLDSRYDTNGLEVRLQANDQNEVRRWRRHFPRAVWKKTYSESLKWWEYETTDEGIRIEIYGCTEAPPSCRMVSREVEVEEDVPVQFEKRKVTKTVVEWECGEGAGT